MSKVSIRYKVRGVWDEKNRNFRKYLKNEVRKEGREVVSVTNQLKFYEPDGKKRLTDVFDNQGVNILAKNNYNAIVMLFLDWFVYSETVDYNK